MEKEKTDRGPQSPRDVPGGQGEEVCHLPKAGATALPSICVDS